MRVGDLPTARLRNCVLYSMKLKEEVRYAGWSMQVDRGRLIAAVEAVLAGAAAAPRITMLDRSPNGLRVAILTVCERGLSVRGAGAAMDISGIGFWPSPVAVSGPMLRRVLARLPGPKVDLYYSNGRLGLDERGLRAREL